MRGTVQALLYMSEPLEGIYRVHSNFFLLFLPPQASNLHSRVCVTLLYHTLRYVALLYLALPYLQYTVWAYLVVIFITFFTKDIKNHIPRFPWLAAISWIPVALSAIASFQFRESRSFVS
jgi:hypothetical protein